MIFNFRIPCGSNSYNENGVSNLIGKKFYSNSSLIIFELRGNPFSEPERKILLKFVTKENAPYNTGKFLFDFIF